MILYLTSQQHTNLLDFLTEQGDILPVKKMTGNFMLKQFVVYDMRNFSHCTELVLDHIAFGDEDTIFVEAISEFLTMYQARIKVICEGLQEAGVGNIVTATAIEDIQKEIQQSLSIQGMTRYLPPKWVKQKNTNRQYQFQVDSIRITMQSAQSRIGTTTMALGLTAWLGSVGRVRPMWNIIAAASFRICQRPMRWRKKQAVSVWRKCGMVHRTRMPAFTLLWKITEKINRKKQGILWCWYVEQSLMSLHKP